jgi:hypothetical protein
VLRPLLVQIDSVADGSGITVIIVIIVAAHDDLGGGEWRLYFPNAAIRVSYIFLPTYACAELKFR